jgi:hypothetical protein
MARRNAFKGSVSWCLSPPRTWPVCGGLPGRTNGGVGGAVGRAVASALRARPPARSREPEGEAIEVVSAFVRALAGLEGLDPARALCRVWREMPNSQCPDKFPSRSLTITIFRICACACKDKGLAVRRVCRQQPKERHARLYTFRLV